MPGTISVVVGITVFGSLAMIIFQIRDLLRRRRNLKHFERGEPLEKTDDWGD
jgi:hypothetical protein